MNIWISDELIVGQLRLKHALSSHPRLRNSIEQRQIHIEEHVRREGSSSYLLLLLLDDFFLSHELNHISILVSYITGIYHIQGNARLRNQ